MLTSKTDFFMMQIHLVNHTDGAAQEIQREPSNKPEQLQPFGYQFLGSNSTAYHQLLYQSPCEGLPTKGMKCR